MQMLRQKGRTAQHMEKTAKSLSSVLSVLSGSFLSIRSPADFRQAYRTLPFSRKKSFFLQMPIDKTEKSIIIKSGKHW